MKTASDIVQEDFANCETEEDIYTKKRATCSRGKIRYRLWHPRHDAASTELANSRKRRHFIAAFTYPFSNILHAPQRYFPPHLWKRLAIVIIGLYFSETRRLQILFSRERKMAAEKFTDPREDS